MKPNEILFSNSVFFADMARMLSDGMDVTFRAKGSSMLPFIVEGRDSIVVRQVRRLDVGDIVLARVPGKGYVLHRIYRVNGERLVLMGDGNLCATELCCKADVLGKAVKILRNGQSVDCCSLAERRKAAIWRTLLPIRRCLLFAYKLNFLF